MKTTKILTKQELGQIKNLIDESACEIMERLKAIEVRLEDVDKKVRKATNNERLSDLRQRKY